VKTFIEIMKWVGVGVTCFGFAYAVGIMIADDLYQTALGLDAYLDLNAISIWNMFGIFVIGIALVITAEILGVVFKSGERSAAREEQKDE
jgi:F0F1-type ATP synthase membrane subunit c/vacuolar-type H+-ATPase subunit K